MTEKEPISIVPDDLTSVIDRVIISEEEITAKVRELGSQISIDYQGKAPVLIGVMRGVLFFMADLLRAITVPVRYDIMAISRYGPTTETRGIVRLTKDLDEHIEGRHVLFVEDVIDTGLTCNYILRNLHAREPASLEICVLFDRPQNRLIELDIKYKGFELPDLYVVGYGLDYQQKYRNLPYVATLKPTVIAK